MTEAEYPLLEVLHLASLVQGPCFPLTIPSWCCDHPDREGAGGQCLPLVSPPTWSASGPEPVKVPQQRDLLPAPHGRGECPSPMNPVVIFQLHEDPTITFRYLCVTYPQIWDILAGFWGKKRRSDGQSSQSPAVLWFSS